MKLTVFSKLLYNAGLKIHFVLFWFEKLTYPHLISTTEYISLSETKVLISQSKAMIDIQRDDQRGLSFRTFESLGYRKKLITTNQAVRILISTIQTIYLLLTVRTSILMKLKHF